MRRLRRVVEAREQTAEVGEGDRLAGGAGLALVAAVDDGTGPAPGQEGHDPPEGTEPRRGMRQSQGFTSATPEGSKSATFRVATCIRCTSAMAATWSS